MSLEQDNRREEGIYEYLLSVNMDLSNIGRLISASHVYIDLIRLQLEAHPPNEVPMLEETLAAAQKSALDASNYIDKLREDILDMAKKNEPDKSDDPSIFPDS